jgi:sugar lactone lactonase YvrE
MKKIYILIIAICLGCIANGQIISTVAGGGCGDGGLATNAQLWASGTAIDASGNIYIADYSNNRVRKVSYSSNQITTVAGNSIQGYNGDNIIATSASLNNPKGIALDSLGNIYIADCGNNRIRKITVSSGIITTIAGDGTNGYNGDTIIATSAKLNNPTSIALDSYGNIYIADYYNHRIRKVIANTGIIYTVAGTGINGFSGDGGLATSAKLNYPKGVIIDNQGSIYIADLSNHRIRKVTANTGKIYTVAGNGTAGFSGDGSSATLAKLNQPSGIAVDASQNIYIADLNNHRIRKVTFSTQKISTIAGNGTSNYNDNIAAITSGLNFPNNVSLDSSGNVIIADDYNARVRKVTVISGIINTIAGNGTDGFSGDNIQATNTRLYDPFGVALDTSGNIFISDRSNHRIRKVSSTTGIIKTIAGVGTNGFNGDGGISDTSKISYPSGIALDKHGNIYFADFGNHRIRKITASSGIISSIAGNGVQGYNGDGIIATSAKLNSPNGIAIDEYNNIYIADGGNSRIRKVSASSGIITTIAGNGISGFSGDSNLAINAMINNPRGVAIDKYGNIFILDSYNMRIRKVTASSGIITTIAGNDTCGFNGDGIIATTAMLCNPIGIAIDTLDNIFITDNINCRIRVIAANSGLIYTFAGTGSNDNSGDSISAISAKISQPTGISIDASSNIYFAESKNFRIRKVISNSIIISSQPSNINLCINNTNCNFNVSAYSLTTSNIISYQWQVNLGNGFNNVTNSSVYSGATTSNLHITGITNQMNGYIFRCLLTSNNTLVITDNAKLNYNIIPSNAGIISGITSVCLGQYAVTYIVPPIANATSYVWVLPSGATGTSIVNNILVNYSTSAVSGNITVKGVNSCGIGTSSSLAITVNSIPMIAGLINGPTIVCPGQTSVTYSVPAISNATFYVWSLPPGVSGTSSNNTITVSFDTSATSGNISVYGVNSCGNGTPSDLAVLIGSVPNAAGSIIGLTTVCQGQNNVIYTVPSIANTTSYIWTLPNGATGTSNTNSITINYGVSAVSGNIIVKGINSCGNGLPFTLAITVNPTPSSAGTITGQNSVCPNQSLVSYTIPAINNATSYNWTLPTGAMGTSSTNSIIVDYGSNALSGNIAVCGNNTCGNGNTSALPITVNSIPLAAGNISGSSSVIAGQQNVVYSVPPIVNATSHTWDLPIGTSINYYTGTTISINYSQSAVSGNITVNGNNVCGDGPSSSLYITVNPFVPNCSAQFDLVADTAALHHYFVVNNASGIPPLQYNWSWGDGSFSTTAYPTHTYSAAGYYNICLSITDSIGCSVTYCDSSYLQKDPNAIISVQVIPQGTLGISHLSTDKIKIYPNPAKDNLIVELQGIQVLQNTSISIYNIEGQLIKQLSTKQTKSEIDIHDFPAGVYLIKINNEKESFVKKFIKE